MRSFLLRFQYPACYLRYGTSVKCVSPSLGVFQPINMFYLISFLLMTLGGRFALSTTLIGAILYLCLHFITNSIHHAVDQPYMDEIFHIPQAQRYCTGNWTFYDKKITTPPGLYLFSYLRIWLRDKVMFHKPDLTCDTIDLRRTNHLMAIFNFITIVLIHLTSNPNLKRQVGFKQRICHTLEISTIIDLAKLLLSSLAMILLPPLFFFNSLYYTDAGSILFTLLAYLFSENDHHLMASLFGFVSVLFRQTNIVWIFYTACLVVLRTIEDEQSQLSIDATYVDLLRQTLGRLIRRCTPYGIVGISFIIFVVINQGIVLGDKEAHQMRLHWAQLLYFLVFCSIFGAVWMFQLRVVRRFLYFLIRNPATAVLASGLIISMISCGRYAHPYLLADNRHITFYIWRRILGRHNSYIPYLLTPIYLFSCLGVWHHLRKNGGKRALLYMICTMLVTVPNGLLELRYFIIPYTFLRLSTETSLPGLFIEICQHLAINMAMHSLFLHKTFKWADSPEIQRIMW